MFRDPTLKNKLISATATLFLFLITLNATGQAEDPVKWTFTSTKKSDNVYELVLSAAISRPWHIYSRYTPKGGPIPTSVQFQSNPLLKLDGEIIEKGNMESHHDQTFDMEVKYFSDKVAFVQTISKRGSVKTNVRGHIEYMVCDDTKCLPPVKRSFDISIP